MNSKNGLTNGVWSTIGELGKYVQVKVKEQAAIEGREQVPELQGDTEKVLVQW